MRSPGSAAGSGRWSPRGWRRRGATVAGTDRSQETLDALAADLDLPAERWDGRAVDLLDEDAVRVWCAALVERFGQVDGIAPPGRRLARRASRCTRRRWRTGTCSTTCSSAPSSTPPAPSTTSSLASEHGRFVLVSAKQAQAPTNTNAAYAAAKAAAEAWTLAFADGFEPGGATANIIVVDAILTPRMRAENPGKEFPTFTPAEHVADGDRMSLLGRARRR